MQMALAHQMYKAGNFKQALEHSNCVYERSPLRTDNLLLLGAIYYQVSLLNLFFLPCTVNVKLILSLII